jgi:pyruvate formate lyase activating enzyme
LVEIKGLEKFAPKDFPGHISATIFTGGCNFRCPFCHNADLVLNPESIPVFPLDFFLSFLDARKDWLEAICITGGEPLIHEDLEILLQVIKERDLLVKVDTNGSFPQRLEGLIKKKLVDFVAMDVKAPLERYQEVTKSNVKTDDIRTSIDLIRTSGVPYVFRTTAVPGLLRVEDIEKIGELLKGSDYFQLQNFVPENTIDKSYMQKTSFSRVEFKEFADSAKKYFKKVSVEGD